ncbi:SWIM zinc finger protein [Paenibacillus cellulosilyticus]|uniref:SWIM zinc finger protein n=1 Tax=Paenibacillus cellulosilyticus TaxID=375489 RepID=A0A2V2YV40_9BACL|nr:SWIM zinc finger family protein [Paenibacillus cellulosilyticus]PWW04837.1 SWIM zinc finger protein [Paenibacillus cellulosilyticus]QKS45951.1 SWIM zinc finger family protein [Paenibacillus cellulosilyticus]
MISLTEAYVDSLAPNAGAIKNGRDLARKGSFPLRCVTEDQKLLFGECKGSGKEPYRCSIDFVQEGNPVYRCTCPSRQFPCKHTLGLMYAYVSSSSTFETADIPSDVADKRDKAEKREEKKAAAEKEGAPKAPRKVNKSALVKKITSQLEGLSILEKLVLQLVHHGLGSVDKKTIQLIEEQAKQLGNYYIPGAQAALRELLLLLRNDDEREAIYTSAIEQLIYLQALVKKSKAYLEKRAEDPDSPMETDSALEELLGHAWQLAELQELGRTRSNVELLQLSFLSYADHARGEFVDTGWWIDLADGTIRVTRHMRPFRAAKQMKEEDSFFAVVQTDELFVYPGELNARVRWEQSRFRELEEADYRKVKQLAAASYPDVIKKVKNQIKNPLSDKMPVALVAFQAIERIGDTYILRDAQNKQIPLVTNLLEAPHQPTAILELLQPEELQEQTALIAFRHELDSNRLVAQLMSITTDRRIVRLLY